jgi:hypothetical protein
MILVKIEKAFSHSLRGKPVDIKKMPLRMKEESYAA